MFVCSVCVTGVTVPPTHSMAIINLTQLNLLYVITQIYVKGNPPLKLTRIIAQHPCFYAWLAVILA